MRQVSDTRESKRHQSVTSQKPGRKLLYQLTLWFRILFLYLSSSSLSEGLGSGAAAAVTRFLREVCNLGTLFSMCAAQPRINNKTSSAVRGSQLPGSSNCARSCLAVRAGGCRLVANRRGGTCGGGNCTSGSASGSAPSGE